MTTNRAQRPVGQKATTLWGAACRIISVLEAGFSRSGEIEYEIRLADGTRCRGVLEEHFA